MIERLYPGVYVSEVPFNAKPIEGVSTSTASFSAASVDLAAAVANTPPWTDHNQSDPGVTLLELLAWTADSSLYQAGPVGDALRRTHAPWGVVEGLAVDASGAGQVPTLSISRGEAISPDGHSIGSERAFLAHRHPDPWPPD